MNKWELETCCKIRLEAIAPYDSKAGLNIVKSEIFKAMQDVIALADNLEWLNLLTAKNFKKEISSILESRNIKERIE